MKHRDNTFDIIKGITIVMMVIGHSGCPYEMRNFIYLFHMPVFYFVSGYFFNDKYIYTKTEFVKRKLIQLYKPFIVYGLSFLFLSNLFFRFYIIDYNYSFPEWINRFFEICIFKEIEILLAPFWFLRSLFIVSILFLLVRYISSFLKRSDLVSIICIILAFLIGTMLSNKHIILPCQLQREFIVLIFYALGFFSNKYKIPMFINKYLSLVLFLILLYLASITRVDLVSTYYNNVYLFIIGSLLGILFIINLSKYISSKRIGLYFSYLGNNTITILALHLISFKIVSLVIIYRYNLSIAELSDVPIIKDSISNHYWFLYSLIGVIFPILLSVCMRTIAKAIKEKFNHS